MGDVTDFPERTAPGSALAAALKKAEQARFAADQIQSEIVLAAGLLEVFADKAGSMHIEPVSDEIDRQWHQVEYLARLILGHAKDLGHELNGAESALWAANRAIGLSPTDGDAA